MKSLPNVTLISYDNVDDPSRTLRALHYSSREIKFADVVLVCRIRPDGVNGTTIQKVHEKGRAAATNWHAYGVMNYVQTDFALCIHHDGYVINPQAWRDDWLQYDFIGAPWPASSHPCHPGKSESVGRVGNDGFCLKSRAFMEACHEMRSLFIAGTKRPPDRFGQELGSDTFYCQHQRPALEQRGITFAPVEVAADFSWETNIEEIPGDRPGAFGFHNFLLENKQVPRA